MDIVEQLYDNIYIANINTFTAQHSDRWDEFDDWLEENIPMYKWYNGSTLSKPRPFKCLCVTTRYNLESNVEIEEELAHLEWGYRGPQMHLMDGLFNWWYRYHAFYFYDMKIWLTFRNSEEHGIIPLIVFERMLFKPLPEIKKPWLENNKEWLKKKWSTS